MRTCDVPYPVLKSPYPLEVLVYGDEPAEMGYIKFGSYDNIVLHEI